MMNGFGKVTEKGTLRFERILPASIEVVWGYLTDSKLRGLWLATGEMDLRVGGSVNLHFRNSELTPTREEVPEKYKQYEDCSTQGIITRINPPTLLSFTWSEESGTPSEVTFELTEQGKETHLVIVHRRLGNRDAMTSVAGGWHIHVEILINHLAGKELPPFWSTHSLLEKEYETLISSDDV